MAKTPVGSSESLRLNEVYQINGIPTENFEYFKEKSEKVFPEAGSDSWSVALSNILRVATDPAHNSHDLIWNIIEHGNDQGFVTFHLTDIPVEANKSFNEVCANIDSDAGEVIATMYAAALNHTLYMVKYPDTNMPHSILFQNISSKIWNEFRKAAQKLDVEPVELAASIFHIIGEGDVTWTPQPVEMTEINVRKTEVTNDGNEST